MIAPTVASATVDTAATRRPATADGRASGASTRHRVRHGDRPIPVAASRTSGSTPSRPTRMLRTRIVSEYSASAMTTVVAESPTRGSSRMNIASDGIVYSTVVTPRVSPRARRTRWASTASGTATTAPATRETSTR